jgi:hypothetical protein
MNLQYELEIQRKKEEAIQNIQNFPNVGYGEIAILCDKYGCNKGSLTKSGKHHPYYPMPPHTYAEIYEVLFAKQRYSAKYIFECGVGTNKEGAHGSFSKSYVPGASLRVWRDYFVNAHIWGGDIDKSALFDDTRISTGYLDQTSPDSVINFFTQAGVEFDVMLDDGLHTFTAAKCLFENSHRFLARNGIYVIEDLAPKFIFEFNDFIKDMRQFVVKYFIMETPTVWENNLIIIQRNDEI